MAMIGIFFLGNYSGVYAADLGLVPSGNSPLTEAFRTGEFSFDLIGVYIVYLIDVFSKIAVMISFVFVLIGAFRYTIVYLEGDTENGDKAKKTIKNALVGLAVSTLAYVIVDIFIRFLL